MIIWTGEQESDGGSAFREVAPRSHSRVVLADGSPRWLELVGAIVDSFGLQVEGSATTPEAALSLIEEHKPDILVSEVGLAEETDGIAFLRAAQARAPELDIVVLASSEDTRHMEDAFAAGARVYVVKTGHPYDLTEAIHHALERWIDPRGEAQAPATAGWNSQGS